MNAPIDTPTFPIYVSRPSANVTHVCIGPLDLWFSYTTLIAFANMQRGQRYKTSTKHSRITSKHLGDPLFSEFVAVPQEKLHQFVAKSISSAYLTIVK